MSNISKNNTEVFYKDIINKVCERVKEEFLNEGVAEDVLSELKKVISILTKKVWIEKLIREGIFSYKLPTFVKKICKKSFKKTIFKEEFIMVVCLILKV